MAWSDCSPPCKNNTFANCNAIIMDSMQLLHRAPAGPPAATSFSSARKYDRMQSWCSNVSPNDAQKLLQFVVTSNSQGKARARRRWRVIRALHESEGASYFPSHFPSHCPSHFASTPLGSNCKIIQKLPKASKDFQRRPRLPEASNGFQMLPKASTRFQLLPKASKCFRRLPEAARGFQKASKCFQRLSGFLEFARAPKRRLV